MEQINNKAKSVGVNKQSEKPFNISPFFIGQKPTTVLEKNIHVPEGI